jgi:quercetin dioxygenase-like cupin family protein
MSDAPSANSNEVRRKHHSLPANRERRPRMTTEPESTQPAAPATFKRTELQRFPSPIPGWEIVQTLVEIPEGLDSGRHSHPGGPEVGYIVRGDVAMEFDDRSTLTLRAGDPFMIPIGVIHNARNIGTVITKMLSTYVVDECNPSRPSLTREGRARSRKTGGPSPQRSPKGRRSDGAQ